MYDITNKESFNSICEWVNIMHNKKDKNFPVVLIWNKYDLKDQR